MLRFVFEMAEMSPNIANCCEVLGATGGIWTLLLSSGSHKSCVWRLLRPGLDERIQMCPISARSVLLCWEHLSFSCVYFTEGSPWCACRRGIMAPGHPPLFWIPTTFITTVCAVLPCVTQHLSLPLKSLSLASQPDRKVLDVSRHAFHNSVIIL